MYIRVSLQHMSVAESVLNLETRKISTTTTQCLMIGFKPWEPAMLSYLTLTRMSGTDSLVPLSGNMYQMTEILIHLLKALILVRRKLLLLKKRYDCIKRGSVLTCQ